MICGIAGYFIYTSIPAFDCTHTIVNKAISIVQPLLIFSMLFLTFCKIKPQELTLCRWHAWLLLFQVGSFSLLAYILTLMSETHWKVVIEGGMLCLICPTATAAAVVTSKLGGNAKSLTTYTILINLAVAIAVPTLVPLIHPNPELNFTKSFLLIISKVFPLLFCPFLAATLLRNISPKTIEWFTKYHSLAFYLWAVALALAIAVTVKSIVHSACPPIYMIGIAVSSALACIVQFLLGRFIGQKYDDKIAAAQSLGQKNTVFAIWMGYTFMDPITSIAGGFYSIWHNIYNSWQLVNKEKEQK